ncbi:antitoxin MazE family protein [Bradyrhizobium sediminis]|uniref:Antitoxin MazE family protein n=1 Tax=Bradyrhizobium sediminis TaxID=2840469 RepID=A0A975NK05_9BRAD|nr:antitoxin MazE-like protein [Bradyrhizobium sediminis]QWG15936.1 antitoxin MazE family protein [Bradyrhizobium sediminis]
MLKATSLASKSCRRARFWRPETGKKLARGPPPGRRLARLRRELRDPRVRDEIRREAALLSRHPEDEVINDWIEAAYDWDSWK